MFHFYSPWKHQKTLVFWKLWELSKLKKWKHPALKKFLLFQEMELSSSSLNNAYIFSEKKNSYISTLKKFIIFLQKKFFPIFWDNCWSNHKIKNSHTMGWLLIKHRIKNFFYILLVKSIRINNFLFFYS